MVDCDPNISFHVDPTEKPRPLIVEKFLENDGSDGKRSVAPISVNLGNDANVTVGLHQKRGGEGGFGLWKRGIAVLNSDGSLDEVCLAKFRALST